MVDNPNTAHKGATYKWASIAANLVMLTLAGIFGAEVMTPDAGAALTGQIASVAGIDFGDWPAGPSDQPDLPVPPSPPGMPPLTPGPGPSETTGPPDKSSTFKPDSQPGTLGWLLFWAAATA